MKKIVSVFLSGALCLLLAACGNTAGDQKDSSAAPSDPQQAQSTENSTGADLPEESFTITVGVPTAPPTLPILRMKDTGALGENITIDLDIWSEPETLIAMTQDGKHDMFAFPLTVVSTLYNKGVGVRLMNVNTWGVTYFLTSDPDFKDWADLKGQTLFVPLQSSPPDALSQYFLAEEGLTVGQDVQIVYGSTTEIATMLASGEAKYGIMIEPQVSKLLMANQNLRIAFSFEEEWQRVNQTKTMIPNAGFGATQQFIEEYPELTAEFQMAYAEALDWVNDHPAEAGKLAEQYLGLPAAVVEKAVPNMGLSFKKPSDAQEELKMFYELLFHFNPKMIGGKIPDSGLYYDGE